MDARFALMSYAATWLAAFGGNLYVEWRRFQSDGGDLATWLDVSGFLFTAWLILPILPLIAVAYLIRRIVKHRATKPLARSRPRTLPLSAGGEYLAT